MNKLFARIMPFIFLGITIAIFVVGIVLFSYLLILGAMIGLVLFLIAWVKERFFSKTSLTSYKPSNNPGRTIDHDDISNH